MFLLLDLMWKRLRTKLMGRGKSWKELDAVWRRYDMARKELNTVCKEINKNWKQQGIAWVGRGTGWGRRSIAYTNHRKIRVLVRRCMDISRDETNEAVLCGTIAAIILQNHIAPSAPRRENMITNVTG